MLLVPSHGQKGDSLIQLLNQEIYTVEDLQAYLDVLPLLEDVTHQQRIDYRKKVMVASLRLQQIDSYSESVFILSNFYQYLDSLSASIGVLKQGLEVTRRKGHPSMIDMANDIAIVYCLFSAYDQALDYYIRSIEYADSLGLESSKSYALGNMGQIYIYKGDYGKAKEYIQESLNLTLASKPSDYQTGLAFEHRRLGRIYQKLGQVDTAIWHFHQSRDFARVVKDSALLATAYLRLSQLHLENNRIELSTSLQDSAYLLSSNFGRYTLNRLYLNHAKISLAQEEIGEAQSLLKQISLKDLNYEEKTEYYDLHLQCDQLAGDYQAFAAHQQALFEVKEQLQSTQKERHMAFLEAQFKNAQKERKIFELEQKALYSEAVIHRQRAIVIASLSFLLLLVGIALFMYHNNQQKRKFNVALRKQVADQTSQLKQVNRELRQFNNILSHDLKEPLRNLVSFSTLIRRRFPENDKKLQDYLDIIVNSGQQLHTLVNDVIVYQKISDTEGEISTVSTAELLKEITYVIKDGSELKDNFIQYFDLPIVQSSKPLLFTIFKELIENGLTYNESQSPQVILEYTSTPDQHIFNFKDNGIGIDKAYFSYIFQMFKRLNKRDQYPGSGLGLALCRKLAKRIGGELQLIDSTPGVGSVFQLAIPR